MLDVPQDRRVDALLAVAGAVAGAHELDEVLEIAAEEARAILGVSVLSIGRWEAGAIVRTLINVGDLRGKDRWPEDETYDATDFPTALTRLSEGRPHIAHVNDPTCDPAERALMEEMD